MKKYRIEVPASAFKRLGLDETDYSMHLSSHSVVIRPSRISERIPQIGFWHYATLAIISFFVFILTCRFYRHSLIPLDGDYSIATAVILCGTVCGTLSFAAAFISQKVRKSGPARMLGWRSLIPLVLAVAMIIAITSMAVFWILGQMFKGVAFDPYTAGALVFLCVAVIDYLVINLASTLLPGIITNLMTVEIVGGVGFSMLTNSSKHWWRHNFSFLGTYANNSSWQFNITLIFTGLLMMMLVDYLFVNLSQHYKGWGIKLLRGLLYALAATMGAIGVFPNNPRFHILHDRISMWLVYIILILIVMVRWILPEVTKQFLRLSYIIGGILAFYYLVFKLANYLSLTAFELITFMLAFAWILLLLEYIENLVQNNVYIFPIEIVKASEDEEALIQPGQNSDKGQKQFLGDGIKQGDMQPRGKQP